MEAEFPIVLGAGLVIFALTTEAESGSHPDHYGWGGTGGVVFTIAWAILMTFFAWLGWRFRFGPPGRARPARGNKPRWPRTKRPGGPGRDGW